MKQVNKMVRLEHRKTLHVASWQSCLWSPAKELLGLFKRAKVSSTEEDGGNESGEMWEDLRGKPKSEPEYLTKYLGFRKPRNQEWPWQSILQEKQAMSRCGSFFHAHLEAALINIKKGHVCKHRVKTGQQHSLWTTCLWAHLLGKKAKI